MILATIGVLFCLLGALGILRLPDYYTRFHPQSMVAFGSILVFCDLFLAGFWLGDPGFSTMSLVTVLLVLATSPTGSHAIARAAHRRKIGGQ